MTTATFSTSFRIVDMNCGHRQHAVTEALAPLPEIISVEVAL